MALPDWRLRFMRKDIEETAEHWAYAVKRETKKEWFWAAGHYAMAAKAYAALAQEAGRCPAENNKDLALEYAQKGRNACEQAALCLQKGSEALDAVEMERQ